MLVQLASRQRGIRRVVNSTKKIEIPSTAREKFKLEEETQIKSKTN